MISGTQLHLWNIFFFLRKTLTLNKMTFLASNLLQLAELMKNELKKNISNIYEYLFLCPIYYCLM